jgi:myosin protein heavy chain
MIQELELEPTSYRIGQSKIFFRAGVLANLEEERDKELTKLIIDFQSQCRAYLARRFYQKRVEQSKAIQILQRNGLAYLKLRNWPWWRLYTKVRPLLQVTNQEAAITQREEELRQLRDRILQNDQELGEVRQRINNLSEERASLQLQLQTESEERNIAEDIADQMRQRFHDNENALNDLQSRYEDLEAKTTLLQEEYKKKDVCLFYLFI